MVGSLKVGSTRTQSSSPKVAPALRLFDGCVPWVGFLGPRHVGCRMAVYGRGISYFRLILFEGEADPEHARATL